MGFGSTAKKVQKLADVAEKTYKRMNELREQMNELRGTVEATGDRVESLETEVAAQQAVLDAIAEENGLDPAELRSETIAEVADGEDVEETDAPADAGETGGEEARDGDAVTPDAAEPDSSDPAETQATED